MLTVRSFQIERLRGTIREMQRPTNFPPKLALRESSGEETKVPPS